MDRVLPELSKQRSGKMHSALRQVVVCPRSLCHHSRRYCRPLGRGWQRKAASRNISPFEERPWSPYRPAPEKRDGVIARGGDRGDWEGCHIPTKPWIIEGKGFMVYPGLFDSFTDIGLMPVHRGRRWRSAEQGQPQSQRPRARKTGPARCPGATRLANEPKRQARRNLARRRIYDRISAPKGGIFPARPPC